MPGAAFLIDQLKHGSIFLNHVMRAYAGLRIAQSSDGRLTGRHAGIVQQQNVDGGALAFIIIGRSELLDFHVPNCVFGRTIVDPAYDLILAGLWRFEIGPINRSKKADSPLIAQTSHKAQLKSEARVCYDGAMAYRVLH